MGIPAGLHSLFVIVLIAALTPLLIARLPGPRIPEVVLLIVFGIIVGPQALDIANFDTAISLVANFGLGMLFFLAGFELDRVIVVGQYGRAAAAAWLVSISLSLGVVGVLAAGGFVRAFLPVAIALTTTTLGTLLPILRDAGENRGPFGRAMLANGAVGELFPIIAISVFLSSSGTWAALALLLAFGALAYLVSRIATGLRGRSISTLIRRGSETSSQTTVRFSVLLMVALLLLSAHLGLDAVLGAFAAGIVLRVALPDGDRDLERKLDGLAFGFFIPAFFVVSGMQLDIQSILRDPTRMLVFFVLMVTIRGLPVLVIFRRWFPGAEALRMALYSATGLALIVAISAIGLQTGVMRPENAAALVGAGLLTVIALPMTARLLPQPTLVDTPDTADAVPATE